jgi:hypothetical protein
MPDMIIAGFLWFIVWVILVLPLGYLVLRWLYDLLYPKSEKLDLSEVLFLSALFGTLTLGGLALAMLQVGWFGLGRVVMLDITVIVVLAGALWRVGKRLWIPSISITAFTWLCLLLVIISMVIFFHPDEFILGGGDGGVYMNLGAIWARTGSFSFLEPELGAIPEVLRPGLFRQVPSGHIVTYVRFPGFYLSDDPWGKIIPQFFPLHPLWISMAHGLLGLRASLFVTPLWAVGGLLALVLTLRYLFGDQIGLMAGGLLLLTPLQIYFARYPTAEPLTQFLLWGGLYAFVRFVFDRRIGWGIVSAWMLGQVFLTRIDALPLLLLPSLFILMMLVQNDWGGVYAFFLPFIFVFSHALVQAIGLSKPYTWEIYSNLFAMGMRFLRGTWWLLLVGLAVPLLGFFLWRKGYFHRRENWFKTLRWTAAFLIVALGFFAYFVWPRTGETAMSSYWYGGSKIPIQNHLNLVKLGWYLSPLGVWLGICGVAWMIVQESWERIWPLLVVGLSFSLLYIYNILNNPFHIYAMRRYVPVVLPFFVAGMAYSLGRLWEMRIRWRWASWLAVTLGLGLCGWLLYNGRAIWNVVEYQGVTDQIGAIATHFEPDAVLLFEDEPPVGVGATIGTPLQYIHGLTVYDLQEDVLDQETLMGMIALWQHEGRSVYWGVGPSPVGIRPEKLLALPDMGIWLHYPQLETSYYDFPVRHLEHHVPLEFYKLEQKGAEDVCQFPVSLDVGTLDTIFLNTGFYGKEWLGDRSVRWSDGAAVITLPCLPSELPETVTLTTSVAAIRAVELSPVTFSLYLDDKLLQTWALDSDFQELRVEVPASLLEGRDHFLRLESDTWVPQQAGVGEDQRILGVMVDEIAVGTGAAVD